MALLIFYFLLALFTAFLCSLMESILLSTPVTFIKVKEAEGHRSAALFSKIKDNLERSLSAILTLNTIALTVGAAGVGGHLLAGYAMLGQVFGGATR